MNAQQEYEAAQVASDRAHCEAWDVSRVFKAEVSESNARFSAQCAGNAQAADERVLAAAQAKGCALAVNSAEVALRGAKASFEAADARWRQVRDREQEAQGF